MTDPEEERDSDAVSVIEYDVPQEEKDLREEALFHDNELTEAPTAVTAKAQTNDKDKGDEQC